MIFLRYEGKGRVDYIHHMPFHEQHGLGKTKKQLEEEGVLTYNIPEPLQQEGKQAVMYIKPTTKEVYYEYEDIPKTQEDLQQEEINQLKLENSEFREQIQQQNQAISDLTMMIAMGQTPTA